MTTFRPDTSFPYLKIAREFDQPYGKVVRFVEQVECYVRDGFMGPFQPTSSWQSAVCMAWLMETQRRRQVSEEAIFGAPIPR